MTKRLTSAQQPQPSQDHWSAAQRLSNNARMGVPGAYEAILLALFSADAQTRAETLHECVAMVRRRAEAHDNAQTGFMKHEIYREVFVREDEALAIADAIAALKRGPVVLDAYAKEAGL